MATSQEPPRPPAINPAWQKEESNSTGLTADGPWDINVLFKGVAALRRSGKSEADIIQLLQPVLKHSDERAAAYYSSLPPKSRPVRTFCLRLTALCLLLPTVLTFCVAAALFFRYDATMTQLRGVVLSLPPALRLTHLHQSCVFPDMAYNPLIEMCPEGLPELAPVHLDSDHELPDLSLPLSSTVNGTFHSLLYHKFAVHYKKEEKADNSWLDLASGSDIRTISSALTAIEKWFGHTSPCFFSSNSGHQSLSGWLDYRRRQLDSALPFRAFWNNCAAADRHIARRLFQDQLTATSPHLRDESDNSILMAYDQPRDHHSFSIPSPTTRGSLLIIQVEGSSKIRLESMCDLEAAEQVLRKDELLFVPSHAAAKWTALNKHLSLLAIFPISPAGVLCDGEGCWGPVSYGQ